MSEDRKWAIKALDNVDKKKYEDGWQRIFGQKENSCPKGYPKCINCDSTCDFRGFKGE